MYAKYNFHAGNYDEQRCNNMKTTNTASPTGTNTWKKQSYINQKFYTMLGTYISLIFLGYNNNVNCVLHLRLPGSVYSYCYHSFNIRVMGLWHVGDMGYLKKYSKQSSLESCSAAHNTPTVWPRRNQHGNEGSWLMSPYESTDKLQVK